MTFELTTTLDSLSGVLGEFWLPTDTTNKVPGMLTIDPASNTRELSLNGTLSESSSLSNMETIIHGHIGQIPVTLSRCLCIHKQFPFGPERHLVPLIISGAHITDESKKVIRRAYLQFDNMHSWVPPQPINHSWEPKGRRGWDLGISATSKPLIERSNTYFGNIAIYKSSYFRLEQYEAEIKSESTIILTYPNGTSIQDIIEHCGSIRNLANMMTGASCSVSLLDLKVTLSSYHSVSLYLNWVDDRVVERLSKYQVITYTELGSVDAIAKCLNETHINPSNDAVLRSLGSFWRSDVPYNESKFLNMTVALEHLHKSLNLPNSKLEDRLSCIIYPIADDISRFIPDIKWLGKKSVRYRAWVAHANSDDPPEGLLFLLMGSLYLCIMLRYIHDLGADMKAVCNKTYSGHRWFREWDKQLNEAMEKHPL